MYLLNFPNKIEDETLFSLLVQTKIEEQKNEKDEKVNWKSMA